MGKEQIQSNIVEADDTLGLYLQEIGKTPLLTADEEIELAKLIEIGNSARAVIDEDVERNHLTESQRQLLGENARSGERAKSQLTLANTRLVVSKAKKYATPEFTLLDLIQEGNLGLMLAVKKFDYRRGFRFSTYAGWWIRQAITRYIARNGRSLDQEDSLDELYEELGDKADLGANFSTDTETVLFERQRQSAIEQSLQALPLREQRVIEQRFGLRDGEERKLNEVGNNFGITRERVRQIETEALARLRSPQRRALLEGYLGS